MEFKDRLKALRKEKKLTQVKLGEMLNYGYTAIANYESGRNQPSISDLKKIASIFNVSMDYLLGVNDIRYPYVIDDETAATNFVDITPCWKRIVRRIYCCIWNFWLNDKTA